MSALRKPAPSLFAHARRILTATIFLPGLPSVDPVELPTWEQLKMRLADMAAGRRLTFMPGRCDYPDFDTFWGITVRIEGGDYLCAIADRWYDEVDMVRALAEMRRLG